MSEVKFEPERLRKAMEARGMGDTELAQKSGVSRTMIYYLKTGKRTNASAETLHKMALALNTTPAYLMGGEANAEEPPMQRLPESIRQLAEIASGLSGVRQEELIRIAGALRDLEREHREQGVLEFQGGTRGKLMEIAEQLRDRGGNDDLLETVEAMLQRPASGWLVDLRSPTHGADNPRKDH